MNLKRKVIETIKKNDSLYVLARYLKNRKNPEYIKLLKGYYECYYNYVSLLIAHNGIKYPDLTVYHIRGFKSTTSSNVRDGAGLCAVLLVTLQDLIFSDSLGTIPVVEWGTNATYYDSGMDSVTKNVFEYYFEPVSMIKYTEINNCKNVIESRLPHQMFFRCTSFYEINQDEMEKLGYIYNKYIHLNQNTKEYIENNVNNILHYKTVLAVHVRGTDFNVGFKDHPIIITAKDYLEQAKELCVNGKYDKVFLATDDLNALKLFRQEFKNKLLYYSDVFRTENNIGSHNTFNERPLHYYRLGLEVLRDVYTLAQCDSLICGLSCVSFAARYVNIAMKREFKEIVVLDRGIYAEDSNEAKVRKRQLHKNFGGGVILLHINNSYLTEFLISYWMALFSYFICHVTSETFFYFLE